MGVPSGLGHLISMDSFDLAKGSDECKDVSSLCLVEKILAPKTLNKQMVTNIIQGARKVRAKLVISPWGDNVFFF